MARSSAKQPSTATLLRRLEAVAPEFGPGRTEIKLELIRAVSRRNLAGADLVSRYHEVLCFLRALPDDAALLDLVERELESFAARKDLARCREELENSGIVTCDIVYPYFWNMACRLIESHPGRLTIEWEALEHPERPLRWVEAAVFEAEKPAVFDAGLSAREWLARLAGPSETDAEVLIRLIRSIDGGYQAHRTAFESMELVLRLRGSAAGPSRSLARDRKAPAAFRSVPLRRGRPRLEEVIGEEPHSVEKLSRARGRALIDLACEAMITRDRDLDSFSAANPDDVWMIDCGDGLAFACIGLDPIERVVLETVYAFLTLQNGVPVGYVLVSALFRSSEIAYNVFETFRGGESAWIYAKVLSTARSLFGSDAFTVYPYQLGHGNDEGLQSGAFWFYRKLGFAPRDAAVARLLESEEKRMRRDPGHRSSLETLARLAAHNVFWFAGEPRDEVIGLLPLVDLALGVSDLTAGRFGADRGRARKVLTDEAMRRLGLASLRGFDRDERAAFERFSPVLALLEGVEDWSDEERRALIELLRAKGAPSEMAFPARFDAHPRLGAAVAAAAQRARRRASASAR